MGAIPADKMAAINQTADQFMATWHQSLDVFAMNGMMVPNLGTLYREYPGEFLPFSNPRMTKDLLKNTDGALLNRKLFADWNLVYLTSLLLNGGGTRPDSTKAFPSEFMKLAKKSDFMKAYLNQGNPVTMSTATELNRYLAEADQVLPALRASIKPEMFPSKSTQQPTVAPPGSMGFDTAYMIRREGVVLVMIEQTDGFKVISLAAPDN